LLLVDIIGFQVDFIKPILIWNFGNDLTFIDLLKNDHEAYVTEGIIQTDAQ
jgi:hypothetical protein